MNSFRLAVESGKLENIASCLAEDVVFKSPIVFKPYQGRVAVTALLRAVLVVLQDFRYHATFENEHGAALEFSAKVGGREVQGIDLLELDAQGLVKKLTVFVRPLTAAHALASAMQAELGQVAGATS